MNTYSSVKIIIINVQHQCSFVISVSEQEQLERQFIVINNLIKLQVHSSRVIQILHLILMDVCLCLYLCVSYCRTCPVVTTVVSMARAVRKAFRESYVDRCGPLGVLLCTKYRLLVFLLHPLDPD